MSKLAECGYCNTAFEVVWGRWSRKVRRLRYCSPGCRNAANKIRAHAAARAKGWYRESAVRRNRATLGRQCKWEHCRVDDEHHIGNWNAPNDTCPSCIRQLHREAACARCGGPQYHSKALGKLQCPNCQPRQAQAGEIIVVLVCSATGREREIVRKPHWILPDGRKLAKAHDEGFLVIDVVPTVWAKYRF